MAKKKKVKNGGLPTYEEYAQKTGQLKTYEQYTTAEAQNRQKAAAQAKQRQQESVSRMTSFIRDTAAHEQNSRNDNTAPSTYAAKMMLDSHSSIDEENARRQRVNDYLEGLRKKRQEKQETSSFANYRALNKPETPSSKKTYGKKTTELEDLLISSGKKPKGYQPEEQQETPKREKYATVEDYNTFLGKKTELQKQGAFDSENNPHWWSDEKLETGKNKTQSKIDDINRQREELEETKQESENWYPETAMQDWEDLYSSMKNGTFSQGENLLAYLDDDQNILNRAKDYYGRFAQSGQIRDDDASRQAARERAFNYVFGYSDEASGMYDTFVEDMTPEEKAYLDDKLDGIIEGMQNPYSDFDYERQDNELSGQLDSLNKELGKYTGEQDQRRLIADLEANAPDATGIADPERRYLTGGNNAMQYIVNSITGPQGDDMDKAFWEIRDQQSKWNRMTTAEKLDMLSGLTGNTGHDGLAESLQDTTTAYGQYYAFMTPKQVEAFEKYYLNGNKESARAYLNALRPYLQMYANEYSKQVAQEAATGDYGWFYGAKSIAEAPMNALVSAMGTGLAMLGNEEAGSANSTWFRGQNIQNQVRGGRREAWGRTAEGLLGSWAKEPAEFLNGVFYSMADMAMATGLGGVFSASSEISQPLVQFVMSSEAAANTMTEQLERGIDPQEAALYAIGSGTIEWLTEKYSIEQLLNPNVKEMLGDKKQIAKFIAKNFVAEGSEEGASSVLEIGLDALLSAINGHESELQEKYNELRGTFGDDKAAQMVLLDQLKQTGLEMLAGGVSGLLMASARVGANTIEQRAQGQQVRTSNTTGTNGTDAIIDAALSLNEEMQSRKLAEEMNAKREAGKKISDLDLGRLVQNIGYETNEDITNAAMTVVEDRAYDLLEGKDLQGMDRREAAQLIAKATAMGSEMSRSEMRKIINNKELSDAFKEFNSFGMVSFEANAEIAGKAKSSIEARDSVSELLGVKKPSQVDTGTVSDQMASEQDKNEALQAAGRSADSVKAGEVVVDGEIGKVTGMQTVTAEEVNEDGEKVKVKQAVFTVEKNGKKSQVKSSQIGALDFGTAAIIKEAAANPGLYETSENQKTDREGNQNFRQYTDILLEAQANGKLGNIGTDLANAQRIRMAAFTGQAMPILNMDRGTALEIYKNAAAEHKANREGKNQTGSQNAKAQGTGEVSFQGVSYNDKNAWSKKIKEAVGNDKNTIREINAAAEIARRKGIDLTFYTAEEAKKVLNIDDSYGYFGWETESGIGVNIEGIHNYNEKTKEGTGRHHIMVTFGHEMTHWLQRNSLKGYNELESFVMNDLAGRRGEAYLQKRLGDIMQNQDISLEDAMSELVADSCDQILADESVRQHIAETNQSLFTEIKGFVKDLVSRIREAVQGMDESMSWDARTMMDSANRLAKVWLGAYDDVLSGVIRKTETETTGAVRNSKAQIPPQDNMGYMESFGDQLRRFKADPNAWDRNNTFIVGKTPKLLQNMGMTILPVTINKKHIEASLFGTYSRNPKFIDDHTVNINELEKLPQKIEHPIGVIKSNKPNKLIMFVDMKAKSGKPLIAPIEVNTESTIEGERFDAINLATLHRNLNVTQQFISAVQQYVSGNDTNRLFFLDSKKYERMTKALQTELGTGIHTSGSELPNGLIHTLNESTEDVKPKYTKQTETENFKKWFGNSVIKNEDGTPKVMYHGTLHGGFDVFDGGKDYWYFTDSKDYARVFAGRKNNNTFYPAIREGAKNGTYTPKIYEVYLSVQNPFITEDQNIIEDALYWDRSLAQQLRDRGYDALMMKDQSQVIVLNKNQIKSATDNIGMFDRRSNNIRFSKAQLDSEYDQAVNDGDTERQQKLVDQAAKDNGYTMKVYHGTPYGGFTQFRDWSYFTQNKDYADRYNHPSQSSTRGRYDAATQPMTYGLYMNPGRVLDTRKPAARKLFNQIRMELGMSELTERGLPDWTDGRDLIEYIEENNLPYDTIILDEGADGGYGEPVVPRGESYVTRPNMVKSADPVTYDDNGNVIPLSERFNKENNDIRFSMAQPVEQVRDLVAVHNMTEQNLLDTLAEGGFTAPSIAVVKAKMGHSKFGPISVIFKSNVIDPQASRKNKIFGTDAWTPTRSNAQIETKLDYEVLQKARDTIQSLLSDKNDAELWQYDAMNWINQWLYKQLVGFIFRALTVMGFFLCIGTEMQERYSKRLDLSPDNVKLLNKVFLTIMAIFITENLPCKKRDCANNR